MRRPAASGWAAKRSSLGIDYTICNGVPVLAEYMQIYLPTLCMER